MSTKTKATKPVNQPTADKAAVKKPAKVKPTPRTERILAQFDYTNAELAVLGQSSGRMVNEIAELERQMKAAAADFKGRIDYKKAEQSTIATKLTNGYEMRETVAEVIFNTKTRRKTYVDPKNHKRVYREDPMTEADWQLPLFRKEELAKTKVKPPGANTQEKPPGETNVGVAIMTAIDGIVTAGREQTRVEFDRDAMLEAKKPSHVIDAFKKSAHVAQWNKKALTDVVKIAKVKATEGVEAVVEFLTQFAIE